MIDARGGVLIRFSFPAPGPYSMHFYLSEIGRPNTQQILRILSALYGAPEITEPRLHSVAGRKDTCDEPVSNSALQAVRSQAA